MTSIRNVAIIAHVDHGKTTLVDGLLKQSKTFRDNEAAMSQRLLMDSNDQERERGITILAKNTAIVHEGIKINIIDTPGHADFGGEVERTLNMADGAILMVDAQEGPMPQTKFVLKKALGLGLQPIVVINKLDKPNARVKQVIDELYDLFLDVAVTELQLDFPIYYAIGREGKAWDHFPEDMNEAADLTPIFDAIIEHIPEPNVDPEGPFQMLVSALDYDQYHGKYAIGRIQRGHAKAGSTVIIVQPDGSQTQGRIDKILVTQGLKRLEITDGEAGDIVVLSGLSAATIGCTLCDPQVIEALPSISVDEPTLRMAVGANTSPFSGREGQFVTGRQLLDRIKKELETNVSMRLDIGDEGDYILSGRGELHLSVFIEQLRREGYELQVGKPHVITKVIDGIEQEPVEELTVDVAEEYAGGVTGEIGKRRGLLLFQHANNDGSARLVFEIPTRGLLGLRNQLLTMSRGTAVMNSIFLRYEPVGGSIPKLRNGVLIASESGKAQTFGLNVAQGRGITFIGPQTEVYEGMIIGLNTRDSDIEINVVKEKKQSNVRSSTADITVGLTPYTEMSLEQYLDFLEDDELLEVTPKNLRLRKKLLTATLRSKARPKND